MAAEPSKTFSQPHSSTTLHFTRRKPLGHNSSTSQSTSEFFKKPTLQPSKNTHVWNPTKPGLKLHWNTKGQRPLKLPLLRKYQIPHGFTPRLCWAIPPNGCSASRDCRGFWDSEIDLLQVFSRNCRANRVRSSCWDSEKDLLEAFSICCPANEVLSSYGDSEKDLLEALSICCLASQVVPDCWDAEKDLLEVFSICCPASAVRPNIPSHQTLQQAAPSNSCFPNANRLRHLDVDMMLHCQCLAWVPFHPRCLHIDPCSTPSQPPGEMPQEAWWAHCFWGPGTKGIRGCERFLAFVAVFAAMSVVA